MHLGVIGNNALFLKLKIHAHKRRQDGFIARAHELRERGTEMLCRQFKTIVRDQRKHVVHLVRADTVNDIVNDAVVPVHGRQLAAHKVPLGVGVPRQVHLGVMQECDNDEVAGEDEVRYDVVDDERRQATHSVELIEHIGHQCEAAE